MLEVGKKAAQNKTSQKGVGATDTSKNLIVIFASPLHNSWLCESQNMMTSSAGLIHTHLEWATLCLPATRLFFRLCDGKTLRSARSFKLKQEKKPCFFKKLWVFYHLLKTPTSTHNTHTKRGSSKYNQTCWSICLMFWLRALLGKTGSQQKKEKKTALAHPHCMMECWREH